MRFADPWLLFLAIPAAGAAWAGWLYAEPKRASLAFPGAGELSSLSSAWTRLVRALPYGLKGAAFALIALALARPQFVRREFGSSSRGVDVMLVLDTSTSMFALDFSPMNRIQAAKETARKFIEGRVNDRIGLIVFGGAPVLACPLTTDYAALLEYLDGVDAGMTQTDGTAIGDAVVSAVNRLSSSPAKSKVIVLLTDGANNAGAVDPVTAAKTAAAFGIRVYAVGTAKRGQAFVPVDTPFGKQLAPIPDELDEDVLNRIAAETDGKYFRATNLKELKDIFAQIDGLEKSDVRKPPVASYTDLYPWLAVPALLILLTELALSQTLLLKMP